MPRKQLNKSEIKEFNKKVEQYNVGFDKKDKVEIEDEYILVNGELSFFYFENKIMPTLKLLLKKQVLKKVIVDMGAVKFVINGADIMRPGITYIDETIEKDEIIVIVDEKHQKPLAIGIALFSGIEMKAVEKGKVIQNIHFVGDKIWNYKY